MRIQHLTAVLILLLGCNKLPTTNTGKRFVSSELRVVNALSIQREPTGVHCFSDLQSPIAFALHQENKIGFAGPFITKGDSGYWIPGHIVDFSVLLNGIAINNDFKVNQHSEPGMLVQELQHEKLFIELRLFFHSTRNVIVDIQAQNLTDARISVDFVWPASFSSSTPEIASFPPESSAGENTKPRTQHINFLGYEHRHLEWNIVYDEAFAFAALRPSCPKHDSAYTANCARWKLRTSILAQLKEHQLATQCIELLYGSKNEDLIAFGSDLENANDMGRSLLISTTPIPAELLSRLQASKTESEAYLRAHATEIPNVLASLLTPE